MQDKTFLVHILDICAQVLAVAAAVLVDIAVGGRMSATGKMLRVQPFPHVEHFSEKCQALPYF